MARVGPGTRIENGFDAREGLEVQFTVAQSATFAVQGVIDGSIELGGTTMEAAIHAIDSGAPITVVAAGDMAFAASIITAPEIHTPTDPQGKQAIMPVAKQSGDLFSSAGCAPAELRRRASRFSMTEPRPIGMPP